MKTEIVLTEKQKADISEVFAKLTDEEKDLLSACCVLCKYGVSRRDMQKVLDMEPSVLCAQIDVLLREGVLVALGSDIVFAPQEATMTVLPIHKLSTSMLNSIIEKLIIYTIPSMYIDALEVKPFFDMTEGTIDYIVEYSLEELDWELFAKLVANYAFQYDVYGRTEIGILSKADLLVMRVLELTRTKVKNSKKLYNKLMLLEALQWINGFHYREAQTLLEEVGSTELKSELPLFLLVKGYYYQTYGNQILAFSYLYQAYQESLINGDEYDLGFLRSYICTMIAYLCSLLQDQETVQIWIRKVHWSILPKHNIIRFYFHLTNAMLASDMAKTELKCAENCIVEVNPDAEALSRLYYCWSIYYDSLGQVRRSNTFYLRYCHRHARFGSTEAGLVVHKACEVSRFVADNSLLTAKRLLNQLDGVNLKSKEIAISVRLQICQSYAEYLSAVDMTSLSSTYCDIALEMIHASQPEQDSINAAAKVFKGGHFPSTLSETCFYFHAKKIKNDIEEVKKQAVQPGCFSREANTFKGIREEISSMKVRFPEYRADLDVIAAHIVSQINPHKAVSWWLKIVDKAKGEQRIRVALSAANYCSEIGYYWEEKNILESAMADNFAFQAAYEGLRISLLIELANVTEFAGFRTAAKKLWEELIALTRGTELEAKVWLLRAKNAYEVQDFSAAQMIEKSLSCYKQEEACLDETLSSLFAWKSLILCGQGRYSDAKSTIVDAMRVYPDLRDKSSFPLYYDLAYYCIGNEDDSEARKALVKAKALSIKKRQETEIDELYDLLSLSKQERALHFQSPQNII